MAETTGSPDPVTAIADLLRAILEPISKELAERYTTRFTENKRKISAEMRKYPNHDASTVEALKQDQVDIFVKVRQELERAKAK